MSKDLKYVIKLFTITFILSILLLGGCLYALKQKDELARYNLIMLDLKEDCLANQDIEICTKILKYK